MIDAGSRVSSRARSSSCSVCAKSGHHGMASALAQLGEPGPFWRSARVHMARLFVISAGLFQHLPQIPILPAGRFKIEDQVFDAQPQVIQTLLEGTDGLPQVFVTLAGLIGEFLKLRP